jgi:DHA1 family bicyclomycin/chloramphenicol resistance-like MFS transporter
MLSRAMIRDVASGSEASKLMSKALSILAILIILSPLACGYLLRAFGWQAAFSLLSVFLCLLLAGTALCIPETMHTEKHTSHPWQQFKLSAQAFISSKQAVLATFLGALGFSSYFVFNVTGSAILVDHYDLPASLFAPLFSTAALLQFVAAQTNSYLVAKKGVHFILRIALGFLTFGIFTSFIAMSTGYIPLWWLIIVCFSFAIAHAFILPNSISLALDPLPKTAGFAAAIHGLVQNGAAALLGFMISLFYNGSAITIMGLFATIGSTTLIVFFLSRDLLKKQAA